MESIQTDFLKRDPRVRLSRLAAAAALVVSASFSQAGAPVAGVAAALSGSPSTSMAYVSLRSGDPQIWVRNGQGQEQVLTQGKAVYAQPALAGDGRVAYVAREAGRPVVYTMNGDGSDQQRVSTGTDAEMAPSWSPDGRSLAFYVLDLKTGESALRLLDLQSRGIMTVAGPSKSMGPAPASWSADGKRLCFLGQDAKGRNQAFVVQHDGSGLKELSSKFAPRGAAWAELSPDGKKVVWVADFREKRSHLIVTDVDSGQSTDLTSSVVASHESPRWSADSQYIAFSSTRDDPAGTRTDVYTMKFDGSELRNLSRHPAEDFDPKWSSDGRHVIFASLRSGTSLLYQVDLQGEKTEALAQHASHDMDHSVRPLALSGR